MPFFRLYPRKVATIFDSATYPDDEQHWTRDDWRQHALWLRERLRQAQAELRHAQTKLARSQPGSRRATRRLRSAAVPTIFSPRSAREEHAIERDERARQVLAIRDEMLAAGRPLRSDLEALKLWYQRRGERWTRVIEPGNQGLLKRVSALRRARTK